MIYEKHCIGMMQNNTYVIYANNNLKAIVIDPTDNISPVLEHLQKKNCTLSAILITHAHFDHILGCGLLKKHFPEAVIYLHPDDQNLWTTGGGAGHFGYTTATLPPPDAWLKHNDRIAFDDSNLQVIHTPGHTPGHVIFYSPEMGVVFCGDLIFDGGVGRTDLPGGSFMQLEESIHNQVFTLPEETILLPGHGANTTVKKEKISNPFL